MSRMGRRGVKIIYVFFAKSPMKIFINMPKFKFEIFIFATIAN